MDATAHMLLEFIFWARRYWEPSSAMAVSVWMLCLACPFQVLSARHFFFFCLWRDLIEHFVFFFAARSVRCPDRRVDDLLAFLFSLMPILWTTSDILSDRVCSAAQDSCLWDHFSLFCVQLPKTIVCMIVNMACLIFCWFRHSRMTGGNNPI